MRVKTVPRQRVIQDNRNIESQLESSSIKSESTGRSSNDDKKDMSEAGKDELQGSNEDAMDLNQNKIKSEDRLKSVAKKDKETLKYSEEVLDMSIKLKVRCVTAVFMCIYVCVCTSVFVDDMITHSWKSPWRKYKRLHCNVIPLNLLNNSYSLRVNYNL